MRLTARPSCAHCQKVFKTENSLARHRSHSPRCLACWHEARTRLRETAKAFQLDCSEAVRDCLQLTDTTTRLDRVTNLRPYNEDNSMGCTGSGDVDDTYISESETESDESDSEELIFIRSPPPKVYYYTTPLYENLRAGQLKKGSNPFEPFKLFKEWELVNFIHRSSLTTSEINELMKLSLVNIKSIEHQTRTIKLTNTCIHRFMIRMNFPSTTIMDIGSSSISCHQFHAGPVRN